MISVSLSQYSETVSKESKDHICIKMKILTSWKHFKAHWGYSSLFPSITVPSITFQHNICKCTRDYTECTGDLKGPISFTCWGVSVLSDEEGSSKWHQGNQKQTQSNPKVKGSESWSVMSDSLRPYELHSPWNSLGHYTGVGSLSLLHGIFPTQGLNPGVLHLQADSLPTELSGKTCPKLATKISVLHIYFSKRCAFLSVIKIPS